MITWTQRRSCHKAVAPSVGLACLSPATHRNENATLQHTDRLTVRVSVKKKIETYAEFSEAYRQAYTMSQLFLQDERPAPIPVSEHEQRRRKRDIEELVTAARRRGKSAELVQQGVEQLEALLPNILNLHKMKAADWVTLVLDTQGVAEKIIILRSHYPKADIFHMLRQRPKLLLLRVAQIEADAAQVKRMLSAAPDPEAILQAVPDLLDPITLSRSLAQIKSSFPGQDPVQLLQKHPDLLNNMGEASIESDAEYGELSTKD